MPLLGHLLIGNPVDVAVFARESEGDHNYLEPMLLPDLVVRRHLLYGRVGVVDDDLDWLNEWVGAGASGQLLGQSQASTMSVAQFGWVELVGVVLLDKVVVRRADIATKGLGKGRLPRPRNPS